MVRIAVLGCGQMGIKIAGELALHGHHVKIYDNDPKALDSVRSRIDEDKEKLKKNGIIQQLQFPGQVLCFSRIEEAVRDVQFVFEAVLDDLDVKRALFESVSVHALKSAILCSNTLNLNIDEVMAKVDDSSRTLGLRYLFPVYAIPEVEIRPCTSTSSTTVEKTRHFLERMGKTLFFRSGDEPLILTEEQREFRELSFAQQSESIGIGGLIKKKLPMLVNHGKIQPLDDANDLLENNQDCAICMDKARNCLLCPCHHMITCTECATTLLNRHDSCPICRQEITQTIKVYHS